MMNNEFKEMFGTVRDLLFDLNGQAIKEEDQDARNLSCNLIEIIDSHMI